MISIYKNVSNSTPIGNIEVDYTIEQITSNSTKYYDTIQRLREYEKGDSQYESLKKQIPVVTWAGCFKKRNLNSLVELSNHIYIDVDGDTSIKDVIIEEEFVKACWTSVGGNGLGFLVESKGLNKNNFKSTYRDIANYFAEKGVIVDSLPDYSRCNILSYDNDVYYNPDALLYPSIEPKIIKQPIVSDFVTNKDMSYDQKCMAVALAYTIKTKGQFSPGYRHNFTVTYAGICNQFGVSYSDCYMFLLERGMTSNVTLNKITNIYQRYSHQYGTKQLKEKE